MISFYFKDEILNLSYLRNSPISFKNFIFPLLKKQNNYLLCVVVVTISESSKGEGITFPATNPLICAISETK